MGIEGYEGAGVKPVRFPGLAVVEGVNGSTFEEDGLFEAQGGEEAGFAESTGAFIDDEDIFSEEAACFESLNEGANERAWGSEGCAGVGVDF